MLWLFFTIFGAVLFIPSLLLLFLYNRFKNTIVLLIKQNGSLKKIIITDKELEIGQVTKIGSKKIKPITISKDEIYYGKWRRWIVKPELNSPLNSNITDTEIEEYLNNEDLIKLYLAGKFKDTFMLLLGIIIACIIISGAINGYLTNTKECIIVQDNSTKQFIIDNVKIGLREYLNGTYY
jgi:hypothetical protein